MSVRLADGDSSSGGGPGEVGRGLSVGPEVVLAFIESCRFGCAHHRVSYIVKLRYEVVAPADTTSLRAKTERPPRDNVV